MADSPKYRLHLASQAKKELTMETRLLLAFLLMGLVLFLTPYFYKPPPPPPKQATRQLQLRVDASARIPAATPKPVHARRGVPNLRPARSRPAPNRSSWSIPDLYRIRFSNRGAVVRSWVLKKYLDHAGKPQELVNQAALDESARPVLPFAQR